MLNADLLENLRYFIERNDADSVSRIHSACPAVFELATNTWEENPLLIACRRGSWSVAEHISGPCRNLATAKSKEGYTALHLASANGNLQVVAALVKQDPKLCFVKDRFSMIPLQTAIVNGNGHVIKELVTACPDSFRKTTKEKETVFHLAVKNWQTDAFAVLLEEANNQKQRTLLHRKDREGNNVLHIATSNNQIEIVKLLFPVNKYSVRVNSLNKKKLTALDLCYENAWDNTTRDICHILKENGAVYVHSLPMRARLRWTIETKNVILVVLGLVTGAAFTTVCNLPDSFHKDDHANGAIYHAGDVISCHLPPILYLMVFNTAILAVCMGAIVVLLWSLPFRPVVLFVTVSIGFVYAILMHGVMPKFYVRIGDHNILSSCLVLVLVITLICFAGMGYCLFACALSRLWRFVKWLIQEIRNENVL